MAQTVYNSSPAVGRPGQPADVNDSTTDHKVSDGNIFFGAGVSLVGMAEGKVKLPAASTDIIDSNSLALPFGGVAMASQIVSEYELNPVSSVPEYLAGIMISVIIHGQVWVNSETAVDPTDQVFLRHTANGNLVPGNFRNDNDGGKAASLSAAGAARWMKKTTGAGPALLRLEL